MLPLYCPNYRPSACRSCQNRFSLSDGNSVGEMKPTHPMHVYEVRPRKDKRGVDLISDTLPFGRLWYDTPDNAIGYAIHSSRSHSAVIHVYDAAGNIVETHE